MSIVRVSDLLGKWRQVGVELRAENGNLVVAGRKGALTPEIAAEIKLRKADVLAFLAQAGQPSAGGSVDLVAVPRTVAIPLSSAQQRLWYIDLMAPGTTVFNVPFILELSGKLDVVAIGLALNAIISRHEALRTRFVVGADGEPYQVIAAPSVVEVPITDLSSLPETSRTVAAEEQLSAWSRQPFDLSTGPLFRLGILRVGTTEHLLSVTAHHIVYDGLSHEIFVSELQSFYRQASQGIEPNLPSLQIQYADYAVWQRKSDSEIHTSFWKEYLKAPLPVLDLPALGPRPALQTSRGAVVSFNLPEPAITALNTLARKQGATLFMVLLAAWKTVLHRFTGQDDLIVGTPIANRPRRETELIIGFFANTLVVRTSAANDPSFIELLERVRVACLSAFSHQETPFDSLVRAVNPVRDTSRTPLYQTMFAMDESSVTTVDVQPGELCIKGQRVGHTGAAQTDVSLSTRRNPDGMRFAIDYNVDLFDAALMSQLATALQLVLENVPSGTQTRISSLPVLSDRSREELLTTLCPKASPYPINKALHHWFEEQAQQSPHKLALRCGDDTVSYGELDVRANQLAHQLRSLGVERETRVGVCMSRSIDLVVALFGVLKAQGAYVPLDPSYPLERLGHMLDDSAASVVVFCEASAGLLTNAKVQRLVIQKSTDAAWPTVKPDVHFGPNQLAYVIYTSGSTGVPKGVMIEHHNTANLFSALAEQLSGGGVWFADTSVSFDISVLEIFGALGHGFEVILRKDRHATDEELPLLFSRFGVTHFQCTPSQLSVLLADAAGGAAVGQLRQLIVGGEALSPALLRTLREHFRGRLFDDYGPTETTVWSTSIEVQGVVDPVPIGRPIANTRAYVLDSHGALVPRGVIGELWLGGAGVGRGYHNRADLTAERFVSDRFANDGSRMYGTGDKVKWRADGTLEYRGRNDAQVKIRGHRIELGEIENALRACKGVEDAAVIVRQDVPGVASLVAFYTAAGSSSLSAADLRAALRKCLPDVMIPGSFCQIDVMPLGPTGKADRRALHSRELPLATNAGLLTRPRNAVEAALATCFASVLQLPEVGVDQNFFDLGGHSLLVVNLVRLLRDQHGIDVAIGTLFSAPTVAELAVHVLAGNANALDGSVVPLQTAGPNLPLYFICGVQLYQPVVTALGEGQPCFGVFVPAEVRVLMTRDAEKSLEVRKLAGEYIKAIRKHRPHGPYCLAGISFGGVLAYEIAQQLSAQGEEVPVIALLDTVLPRGVSFNAAAWAVGQLKRLSSGNVLQALEQRLRRPEVPAVEVERGFPNSTAELEDLRERLYADAMKNYDPTMHPFDGKGVLFRAQDQSAFIGHEIDSSCGWTGLFQRGLDVHNVPGDHLGVISEKHVAGLATTLRRYLDFASKKLV